jgi:hypothetical protein
MATAVEALPEPSRTGTVVLEIGGEVGAAAIYVPASLAGLEIEIRGIDEEWCGTHVAVRERLLPDRTVWAALFPSLTQGDYEIRVREWGADSPTAAVSIAGGRVTAQHWQVD